MSRHRPFPGTCNTLVAISLLVAVPTLVAEEELVTDRPDQTESSEVVQAGRVQVEIGFTRSIDDEASVETTTDSGPETLVRIGLARNFELRLGFAGYQWEEVDPDGAPIVESDGPADTNIGFKLKLADEKGQRPAIALIAGTTLPTGDTEFSTDDPDPAFRVTFANTLTDRLSIGYNAGVAWASEEDADRLSRFEWTAALGITATDRIGLYVELFGDAALSDSGGPANSFNGGLTWLVRDNVQLDLAVGIGLSDAADDGYAGVGVSFRLPR